MNDKPKVVFTAQAIHQTNRYGDFNIHIARNLDTEAEHVVLVKGDVRHRHDILCRVASECLPGSVLDAATCDCKEQLELSLAMISKQNLGIVVYLRQEGRGHGLETKVRALANKNKGHDTFTAVEMLGLEADVRKYWEAAEILKILEIASIHLLTNNPEKISGLENEGIVVSKIEAVEATPTEYTRQHLLSKKQKGHRLTLV